MFWFWFAPFSVAPKSYLIQTYFIGLQSLHQILFVRKDQQWHAWQLLFLDYSTEYHQEFFKLFTCLLDSFGIGGVDNVDEGVGVGKVVAPILTKGFLSSDVPYVEFELVMGEVFDVEALGGSDGADILG
jgi:hypothetical protein